MVITTISRRLALALWLLLCLATPSWAALSAATVWEVRASTGSDNNGGGWHAGSPGIDYTQQAAAQLTDTDLATTGVVTTVTSVTGGFTANMVGDLLHVVSGTNWTPGFYEITAFTNGNTVTVDRAPTTAAGVAGTGSVGGALATLGTLSGAMVASNKAFCTGAFTTGSTITFAQSVSTPAAATLRTRLIGYTTTRTDNGRATLTLTSTGLSGIMSTGAGLSVENLFVDCASQGTSTGMTFQSSRGYILNCKVANFATRGIYIQTSESQISDSEVTGGLAASTLALDTTGGSSNQMVRCYIHDNACSGCSFLNPELVAWNLIANNTGGSSHGIIIQEKGYIHNNTIHGNGGDGIRFLGSVLIQDLWRNNLITNNGGFGIDNTSAALPASPEYDGNAYFGNTSGARHNIDDTTGISGVNLYTNTRDVILTGLPYVGPTSGGTANFGLNNVAGQGAAVRGKGSPGAFPGLATTVGALDFGAVQSAGTAKRRIEIIK
jgi:Right handed beta helix region